MQGNKNITHKDTGDGLITIMPWAYSSVTQGTWAIATNVSYYWNGVFYNSTNAAGDQINYKVWLTKGVWQCSMGVLPSYTSAANITVQLDSVYQGQMDYYNSSAYWQGINGPVVATSTGLHTLSLIAQKGVANAAYIAITSIVLERGV